MVNITFFELEDWEVTIAKKTFKKHKLQFFPKPLRMKDLPKIKNTEIIVVFVNSILDKKILDKLPKLKSIATSSTGYDHIDLEECKKRKIKISNVPAYGVNTVAEQAFALILTIARKVYSSVERTKKGKFFFQSLRGFDLQGKTIGIIGTGKIGKHAIKIANGFGMNVIASDPHPDKKYSKQQKFKYVTLNNLLKNSDIITIHAPLNKHTHHLLNSKNMKLIKKGAVLINTARGGLVDTIALDKSLHSGRISAAGLDVLEEEKSLKEEKELLISPEKFKVVQTDWHLLLQHDNVFITPHNAFNTKEAIERIMQTTVENVQAFLKKKQINKVY